MALERRRRRLWVAGAMVALFLGWLGLAAVTLLSAQRDVRDGIHAIDAAREKVDAEAVVEGRLLPELGAARSKFARVHDRLSGPLLAPLRLVPVLGRQLRSVGALSAAADEMAGIAISGVTDARPILAEPGNGTAARAESTRRLARLSGGAEARLGQVALGPSEGLVAPLARARNRLADEIGELRSALSKAATGATAVADILTGPRRYLFFAANNAEMRAGAGMFLSAGELESNGGGLDLHDVRSVTDIPVPADAVPLTGDLNDRWGWLAPNTEWRNLMTSPRFDVAAPLAAQMWVAAGNRPVDGVMALDPVALSAMLAATGPVELDGRRIDERNVEEELLHDQYERFPDSEERPERQEALAGIARAVFAAFDRGSWSLPRLVTGLARSGSGRHLLLWSAQPSEQAAWSVLGVDGSLKPDSLLVSLLSRSGNKLDYFVRVSADVAVAAYDDDSEITLTLKVENTVPLGEPRYVSGAHRNTGLSEGVYLGILSVDIPGVAKNGGFDGVEELAVAGNDGPCRVMGFQFALARGETKSIVARFRVPGRQGAVRIEPSARRPAIRWTSNGTSWSDDAPHVLTWAP